MLQEQQATSKNPILAGFDPEFTVEAPKPAATEPPANHEDEPAPDDKKGAKKHRREIDLGDGSGVQVFEADTKDELIDLLEDAQRNATKKIRQQNRQLKAAKRFPRTQSPKPPVATEDITPLTADEEFTLGQQFSQMPRKSFERLFESVVGVKPDKFKSQYQQVQEFQQAQAANQAAADFLADHKEDYLASPENYEALQGYLDSHNLVMNRENLEDAFDALNERGLLDPPQPEASEDEEEVEEPERPAKAKRIAKPTRKTASSGLSERGSRRQQEPAAQSPALTDEEIWDLPFDQARERIVRSLRTGRATGSQ